MQTMQATIYLAGEAKNWIDANLNWLDSTVKQALWIVPMIGAVAMAVTSKGSARTIKWVFSVAVFLAIVTNLEGIVGTLSGEL